MIKRLTLTLILLLTSCTKEDLMVCGTIVGGYSEYSNYSDRMVYYFRLDSTNRVMVDELTYLSFKVGEYVCLE